MRHNFLQLFVLNGAMLSLDMLAFLLADEKDVFLCPVPGYNSYFQAGRQRWNIEIVSVPFDLQIKVKILIEIFYILRSSQINTYKYT